MFRNLNARALGVSGHQSELIELALTYHFQGFDLNVIELCDAVAARGLEHALRLVRSAKIKLGSFVLPTVWDGDEARFKADIAKLPGIAQVAGEAGLVRATTPIAPASDDRPYHENFELHRQRLAEVAEVLGPHGVRLGLEFSAVAQHRKDKAFEFIHDLDQLLVLVESIGSPHVGVVLDAWQNHVAGGNHETLKKAKPGQIVVVRVAEAPADLPPERCAETDRLLPAEEGIVDVPGILTWLSEIDYDGPVTPTPAKQRIHGRTRDLLVKGAGEALANAWRAAGLPVGSRLAAVES